MSKLRTVIADDEKTSRQLISKYVSSYCTDLEVVGMAADAKEAISMIKELRPDLVFLDVEMPYGNAFDVLEQTSEIRYQVIFVTAYSDYAIKALNYSAAYYILKPIDIDELIKAVERAKELIDNSDLRAMRDVLKENLSGNGLKRIVLPNLNGFEIVDTKDIMRISGNGNYSDLYLASGAKKTISKVLKFFSHLEEMPNFLRIHRSHIINTDYLVGYRKGRGGTVIMSDQSELEVSEARKKDLLEKLKSF